MEGPQGNGLFSNTGSSGMLGLQMSIHQNPQIHHPQAMLSFDLNPQNHHMLKQNHPFNRNPNPKQPQNQLMLLSDEDEQIGNDDLEGTKRKGASSSSSQWQRMKWTDNMVKLLITAVYYIGDDHTGTNEVDAVATPGKKKPGGGGAAVLLQKKGKWKSVSKAMIEKGFFVSPQQCEDKFNDLNKRYKRVNDVLGKGIACKVVENQNLLDSMDHLSVKLKDEVRKLLNSKHLFFREMCAYHNSCGSGTGANQAEDTIVETSHSHRDRYDHQMCHHSSDIHVKTPNSASRIDAEKHEDEDFDGEDNDEDDDDADDDDEDEAEGNHRDHDEGSTRKRTRKCPHSPIMQQLSEELMSVISDGSKSTWEKKQWVKTQLMKLEEQRVSYQCEAFELEKQRLKWVKFSSKKEREMERAKLKNEQTKLENERMVLVLRQKELELIGFQHYQQQQHHQQQHSSNKRGDPSSLTG